MRKAGVKLVRPGLGLALSVATVGAKQYLDEFGDAIAEVASAEGRSVLDEIWSVEEQRRDALAEFKNALSEITSSGDAPLVIVVDELDRCRPDYALSVLEVIKHLFSVPRCTSFSG